MTRIKKLCAIVLVLMIVITAGICTVSAAEASNEVAADDTATGITIYVRDDEVAQPYLYLWNSLPTNDAMSDSYPGEKLQKAGNWFTYYVPDVTKVNAIVTDENGNQHSNEQKLLASSSTEWWCLNGKWTKYDPDQPDPVSNVDMREESI